MARLAGSNLAWRFQALRELARFPAQTTPVLAFYEAATPCQSTKPRTLASPRRSRAAFYSRSFARHVVRRMMRYAGVAQSPLRSSKDQAKGHALTPNSMASPVLCRCLCLRADKSLRAVGSAVAPECKQNAAQSSREGDDRDAFTAAVRDPVHPRAQGHGRSSMPAAPRGLDK